MRNTKNKQLRELAASLPPIVIKKRIVMRCLGKDIPEGVQLKTGGKFIPTKEYNYFTFKPEEVNHYERLKHIYQQQGEGGVYSYVNSVKNSYEQNKTNAEKLYQEYGRPETHRHYKKKTMWRRFVLFLKWLFKINH